MASYTTNLNLTKPDGSDLIDIDVLNDNFDTLDEKVQEALDNTSGAGKQDAIVMGNVLIPASWSGSGPYTQAITTIAGVTEHSKIDLQPNAAVLAQLIGNGVTALYIQNDNGSLTAYALGAAPTVALSVQYTRTEIAS